MYPKSTSPAAIFDASRTAIEDPYENPITPKKGPYSFNIFTTSSKAGE